MTASRRHRSAHRLGSNSCACRRAARQVCVQRAGRTAKLFKQDALNALVKAARGIPHLVDRVAEHALILAYEEGQKTVSVELVTAALERVEP